MKGVILALGLALLTAAVAWGSALAAPSLGLDPWMGVAIAAIAGISLTAGVVWGALARAASAKTPRLEPVRRLGSRPARGELGPDGNLKALSARIAVAMTDAERRQYLPRARLSYVRAAGEVLEDGRCGAWDVHYFSQDERELLRLQVAQDTDDPTAYRVTAEVENIRRWLETMAAGKREAAWEALRLRNPEVPQEFADSTAVAAKLAPSGQGAAAGVPPRRIRSMAMRTARPTPDGPPTVCWVVEAAEGEHRLRCCCDIRTAQVLRTEHVP